MLPIARPLKTERPSGPIHVFPPSVDLYIPAPAAQSPEAFASPVPTYRVSPLESFGSIVIELPDWMPKSGDRNSQFGCPLSAFFVRHTPPPAANTQRRQSPGAQFGSTAIAVIRPPATYVLGTYPKEERNCVKGYSAVLGPRVTHVPGRPLPRGKAFPFSLAAALRAASRRSRGISLSGYARAKNRSTSALPGPSGDIPSVPGSASNRSMWRATAAGVFR